MASEKKPPKPKLKAKPYPSLSPARIFAVEYTAAARLHQVLTIPATADHGPLRVTYGVAGVENDDAPTILLLSGMFGGRWWALHPHQLALRMGVRVVSVDRPGFGGSTSVPLSQRIQVWLETVPILMKKLKAQHVALIATSAGTIYLLHTLYYLPQILSPRRPYAAFLAPWVHPTISKVRLMSIACRIPNFVLGNHWNKVSKVVVLKIEPAVQSACDTFSTITSAFVPKSRQQPKPAEEYSADEQREYQHGYGMSCEECDESFDIFTRYMFAEDTTGANSEALLCLKKGSKPGTPMWGVCEDLETYVPKLSTKWRENESWNGLSSIPKLRVAAYFGEQDNMIGDLGREYFTKCWNEQNCGESIVFKSDMVEGADHDSVGDPMVGALRWAFKEAKWSLRKRRDDGELWP